ncbi:MAG TPA: hypothetical protein VN922_10105, partial [Bacteroidia bacterium]|nr:hypothetical protein [Bacteroidia bacterium]
MRKKLCLIVLINLCIGIINGQNNIVKQYQKPHFTENFRQKALKLFDWHSFEAAFGKHMHINMDESIDFIDYALNQNNSNIILYFQQVQEGSITKDNALQFWLDKIPYYETVYNTKYLAFKAQKNLIEQEARNLNSGNASPMTGGAICNNLDFSNGTSGGWVPYWANGHSSTKQKYGQTITACSNPLTQSLNQSGTNSMNYVHEICTAGNDPHVPISRVPPGHTYSLRLGDDVAWVTGNGYNHQSVKNTFTVTPQNNTIVYWYAAVFSQDQGFAHAQADQPYFKIRMYDQNCNEILCAHYDVDATVAFNGTIPGFQTVDTTYD